MKRLPLSAKHITSHIGVYGDTGVGKTILTMAYLREVEHRGEIAIVWDPDRQYAPKFRDVDRGDWILDPTAAECPYWNICNEYRDEGEAASLSTCFFPDNPNVKDPFWNNSARGLLTLLCALYRPGVADLGFWMANTAEIDKRVKHTEYETILADNAPGMRGSIISHLNQIAQPLRMMPAHPDGRRTFTVRDWCNKRNSWLFITSSPNYSAILNPLHAFFLSSLVQRLISMGPRPDLPRVHMIFEEASTITVQEFHLALIRLRKTNTPIVYLIQNYADLKYAYADRAETAYSQSYYKVFFRLASDESAKKASGTIGDKTIVKLREQWQAPRFNVGIYRRSFTAQPEEQPVVKPHVLQNLPDRTGYIISPGKIAAFKLPVIVMPDRMPVIEERTIPPMIRRLPPQENLSASPQRAQPLPALSDEDPLDAESEIFI